MAINSPVSRRSQLNSSSQDSSRGLPIKTDDHKSHNPLVVTREPDIPDDPAFRSLSVNKGHGHPRAVPRPLVSLMQRMQTFSGGVLQNLGQPILLGVKIQGRLRERGRVMPKTTKSSSSAVKKALP